MSTTRTLMNDRARDTLKHLLDTIGPDLVRDLPRLGSFLRDECGDLKREINLLLDAASEHVVKDLQANQQQDIELLIARLAQRLVQDRGIGLPAAKWAVRSWAFALGRPDALRGQERDTDFRGQGDTQREDLGPSVNWGERLRALVGGVTAWLGGTSTRTRLIGLGVVVAAAGATLIPRANLDVPSFTGVEVAGKPLADAAPALAGQVGKALSLAIRFNDRNGDVSSLKRAYLEAPGGLGELVKLLPVQRSGKPDDSVIYTLTPPKPGRYVVRLWLVDDAKNESKPFNFVVEAKDVDKKPRIVAVRAPARIKTDGTRHAFEVDFEDDDADPATLKLEVIKGSWRSLDYQFKEVFPSSAGKPKGTVTIYISARSAEAAEFRFTLIDAQGNQSAPATVRFEAVAGTP